MFSDSAKSAIQFSDSTQGEKDAVTFERDVCSPVDYTTAGSTFCAMYQRS